MVSEVHHRGPRERMVFQAAQKLRGAGLSAASMRQVAAAAATPRGSLQHYFPDGKDQLVEEALQWAGGAAASYVRRYLDSTVSPTPSGLLRCVAAYWRAELERCDFGLGCPMVGAVTSGEAGPRVHSAARDTLRAWSAPIIEGMARAEVPVHRIPALTTALLAAVEGAIVLARIQRSIQPLDDVCAVLAPALDRELPPPPVAAEGER